MNQIEKKPVNVTKDFLIQRIFKQGRFSFNTFKKVFSSWNYSKQEGEKGFDTDQLSMIFSNYQGVGTIKNHLVDLVKELVDCELAVVGCRH